MPSIKVSFEINQSTDNAGTRATAMKIMKT